MKAKLIGCLALLFFSATAVNADVTFSNLGPNDEFDLASGILVGTFPDQMIDNLHVAFQFSAEVTGTIDSVELGMADFGGNPDDSVTVTVWNQGAIDGEGLPDEPLWVGLGDPGVTPDLVSFNTADVLGPTVFAGETYWVSARATNGDGTYVWFSNIFGTEGNLVFDLEGGSNWGDVLVLPQGAMRVNVTPNAVPEPTLALPVFAMGLLFSRRRSRAAAQNLDLAESY